MKLDIALLTKICKAPGAPGYESEIRKLVVKTVRPLVDEVSIDNMGNVIALVKGQNNPDGKKVMVAAQELSHIIEV